jgi:predicted transcriptional regulator
VAELPREGGQSAAFLGGQAKTISKVMIPLQPVSVKFTDEERAKLKALATALGWTESQVIRESVAAIAYLIQNSETSTQPRIIAMARGSFSSHLTKSSQD